MKWLRAAMAQYRHVMTIHSPHSCVAGPTCFGEFADRSSLAGRRRKPASPAPLPPVGGQQQTTNNDLLAKVVMLGITYVDVWPSIWCIDVPLVR
jgi:hypothetical protein